MRVTLEQLRANEKARAMLQVFDFDVQDDNSEPVWFETEPLEPFEIVAKRNSGCVYVLIGKQGHVLHATSEGQAGVIAKDLTDCLELVIAHPYCQDILTWSRGDLDAMRRILREDIDEFEAGARDDDPEIEEYRGQLHALLSLRAPRDPMKLLHHAVTILSATWLCALSKTATPQSPWSGHSRPAQRLHLIGSIRRGRKKSSRPKNPADLSPAAKRRAKSD